MKLLVRASDWRAGATVCFLLATGITHAQSSAVTAQQFEQSKILAETLLSQRKSLDSLLWAPEELAQKYESRFTVLWDNLLRREDERFAILGAFPFTTLVLGQHQSSEALDLNIARYRFARGGARVSPEEWRTFLTGAERDGYQIVHSEWHHQHFVPPAGGSGAYSEIGVVLHVAREAPAHRVIIRGVLGVSWAADLDAAGNPVPETIGVEELEILERSRPAAFTEVFRVSSNDSKPRILPLVVYDLNGDGLSEVVVGGQNLVVWNRGEGKFEVEPFLDDERSIFDGAVLADFTGDGNVDFVAVDTSGYPILFEGDADGRFPKPGRKMADTHLQLPKAFTAGDIDDDGDLDLYIANYKYAYRQGQMPTPYYDANDGFPAYLLRNDGDGVFTDITESAGVAAKRFRRAYSSSLVDLDEDRDLDLLVVSDYAGFDT
ncbi:MAG: VCBS repeat-containing protein, partial [Gammaproteobacteria bacterium]|nr:VCBS repeat-containing protein [Gammaproteobacteria bacterium]